jgi:hypothetical protein
VQADSILWWLRLSCGILFISRSERFASKVAKLPMALLNHVAPVHWNHINPTGDYSWRQNKRVEKGRLRPLRKPTEP